ncbi:MAG: flagellar hook protein FlgE [Frankiaceae bacterium]|nr:flagellar hook protein FlgE [Frankiaceae bacterium]
MMRSMFSAISGLRAHQTMMDVVGDNIANVNTAGFKSSRVVFENTLTQLMRGGSQPGTRDAGNLSQPGGGINPMQIGLGVRVASIDMTDTQGALQSTGRPTDVAISGAGFLAVRQGQDTLYTRAGSLSFDARGNLTDPTGMIVQGWPADRTTGDVNTNRPITDITLPLTAPDSPQPTSTVYMGGNLAANATTGASSTGETTITAFDRNGTKHSLTVSTTKTGPNAWTATVSDGGTALGTSPLTFDVSGKLTSAGTFTVPWTGNAAGKLTVDLGQAGTSGGLTQYGSPSTAIATEQDGAASASLRSFAIGDDGSVTGTFSNGSSKVLAKVALATFSNPSGLQKSGDSHFRATGASGNVLMQAAGTGSAGTFAAGSLEMSNVDLGQEFTNLIIAQRGFQANSKIISASDELLTDLVNLKR